MSRERVKLCDTEPERPVSVDDPHLVVGAAELGPEGESSPHPEGAKRPGVEPGEWAAGPTGGQRCEGSKAVPTPCCVGGTYETRSFYSCTSYWVRYFLSGIYYKCYRTFCVLYTTMMFNGL